MNKKIIILIAMGFAVSANLASAQNGPPPGQMEQVPARLSNAFTDLSPTMVRRGDTVDLRFSFETGLQAPPAQVNPRSASLGGLSAESITRNGNDFTARFVIGERMTLGSADLALVFPAPAGTVTFEESEAVTILAAEGGDENLPVEPPPVVVVEPPVPVVIDEEPQPEPSSTAAALLSVQAPDASGAVFVQVNGDPGSTWQLEVTSDLSTWSDFSEVVVDENGLGTADITALSASPSFLRGVSSSPGSIGTEEPVGGGLEITDIYALFSDAVEVFEDGDMMVLRSTGVPNHPSPYYGVGHELYEAYNGDNPSFRQNPNDISEQDLVFRVPKNPVPASNPSATRLGPIGISINGVSFFNQYAGPNEQPLTGEINSFDQYGGHPAQRGFYHYHVEPLFLSGQVGRDGFLGVLLDGYPVYGPEENGEEITNAELDEFHGHFGATKDFPEGIYHYHFTDEDPYLNGSGYYGAEGTVTQ